MGDKGIPTVGRRHQNLILIKNCLTNPIMNGLGLATFAPFAVKNLQLLPRAAMIVQKGNANTTRNTDNTE